MIMNIRRLPSGNYQIREMHNGKLYTKTISHRPTNREATLLMAALYMNEECDNKTFKVYAERYISVKENVLSPSTVYCYHKILNYITDEFKACKINDIATADVQEEVNDYAKEHSPKSVRNFSGFIIAVLKMFRPSMIINITLPQKVKNEPYIPSEEDVNKILTAAKDTRYELTLYLCCLGLRKSEIIALTDEDYNNGILHIQSAKVSNGSEYVKKTTKTTMSNRYIAVPEYVRTLIDRDGLHFDFHINSFDQWLSRLQKSLNIPHFSPHKFRHYFASKMLTVTDAKTVQELGGWSSDYTMNRVYAHSLNAKNTDYQKQLLSELFAAK